MNINSPNNEEIHIAILGAGISGLSLAWFLKKKLGTKLKLSIIEKEGRAGGWISTDHSDGFLFEQGPRSFRTSGSGAATLRLVKSLGLKEQVILADKVARQRYLYLEKELRTVSFNPFSHVMRQAIPGILREPFVAKGTKEDESIADFFRRRTNPFISKNIIDSLVSGIYAGDIEKLSMRSCFPQLWKIEQKYGSLLKGLIRGKKIYAHDPWVREIQNHSLFSFKQGAETLPKALAAYFKDQLWLNAPVQSIIPEGDKLQVTTPQITFNADFVISTLSSYAIINLVNNPYLNSLLNCIPYTSVAVVNLGYRRKVINQEGFGYLIPSTAKESILGVVWDSKVFPQQNTSNPETRLTVMIGGAHRPDHLLLDKEQLLKIALAGVRNHMNVAYLPDAAKVTVAQNAIPQYQIGHHVLLGELQKAITAFSPRLKFLGSSFYGVSVNDCIAHAESFM